MGTTFSSRHHASFAGGGGRRRRRRRSSVKTSKSCQSDRNRIDGAPQSSVDGEVNSLHSDHVQLHSCRQASLLACNNNAILTDRVCEPYNHTTKPSLRNTVSLSHTHQRSVGQIPTAKGKGMRPLHILHTPFSPDPLPPPRRLYPIATLISTSWPSSPSPSSLALSSASAAGLFAKSSKSSCRCAVAFTSLESFGESILPK